VKRRDFALGLLLAAATSTARAQQPIKQRRIAIVEANVPASIDDGRRFGSSCAGWVMPRDKISP